MHTSDWSIDAPCSARGSSRTNLRLFIPRRSHAHVSHAAITPLLPTSATKYTYALSPPGGVSPSPTSPPPLTPSPTLHPPRPGLILPRLPFSSLDRLRDRSGSRWGRISLFLVEGLCVSLLLCGASLCGAGDESRLVVSWLRLLSAFCAFNPIPTVPSPSPHIAPYQTQPPQSQKNKPKKLDSPPLPSVLLSAGIVFFVHSAFAFWIRFSFCWYERFISLILAEALSADW